MSKIRVLQEVPCREVRAEDSHNVYFARFDGYYKDKVISLYVIHKGSAQTVTPTLQHYYDFGRVMGEELRPILSGPVEDIRNLMSESEGVCGLHLNGDLATWDELEPGGQFERLTRLADADAALAARKEE